MSKERIGISLCLTFLAVAMILVGQTFPPYRIPVTIVTQKWFGTTPPGPEYAYPSQPGDIFIDSVAHQVYWCAAPLGKPAPACSIVGPGQWVQGIAGPVGPTGAKGATGASGPSGPSGPAGAPGAVGPIGASGPAGTPGVPGATGVQGPTGALGPSGPSGPAGVPGPTGPVGPAAQRALSVLPGAGVPGPAGAIGATGATGDPGLSTSVFNYRFDVGITAANDPGTGLYRQNNVDPALTTLLFFDRLTNDRFDPTQLFINANIGDNLIAQAADLALNFFQWKKIGPAHNYSDWFDVPVEFVASNGAAFDKKTIVSWLVQQVGTAGPIGATGPAGAIGPAGATGAVGAPGANGATGTPGAVGATGPQGTPGAVGPTGPAGAPGAVGATGPAGAAGTPTVLISTTGPVTDPGGLNVYQFNNATGVLTFNAPAGVAGYQRCYRNSTTRTGAITIKMAASNILDKGGTNGTAAGTLVSNGQAGDAACIVSDVANHWYLVSSTGTWTPH